ncbi:GntR family transcriptional regulator [Fusobacterium ulcerans]|uniref:GntR family transcriptional regulator n=1 Tax=Fusobacterium ulcerans TaxID=861 RepID=UPI0034BE1C8A
MLLNKSKSPLYYQLAEIIIEEIKTKNLKEDDKILTEREYCEKYNLSRATVRQGIAYLEKKGYLYKIQGCGTFVSSRVLKQKLLKFYSFTEEMKKQGKTPESKILSFKEKIAGEKIAQELNLDKEEKIFELVRLRLADEEIYMYEKTYLPVKKLLNFSKKDILNTPLYDVLQKKYNIIFSKATERFLVLSADKKISEALEIDEKSPIIKLQRWTYTGIEKIEYTVSFLRGDKFEFEVDLEDN